MGLLDSVLGQVLGGGGQAAGGGGQADLLNAVVGMLANNAPGGGLGGLVQQFQQGGLGNVIGSWISSGQNLPISAEQLQSVLGSGQLAGLAQQLGMPQGDLAGQLSQILPQVVDKLTPDGQMPQGGLGDMGDLAGLVGKMLGGR
jgi:uncharacterized protein YidB (DUF937 family)